MPAPITENTLFYGDNLDILRGYIPDESVDLIYLDPPFNSQRTYNVLFKHESGNESEAQIAAFEDTWHWNMAAAETYHELVTTAPDRVSTMIAALHDFIGPSQMLAYLVMMAARLVELHRVLKPAGSLYLHCDPTASHYLKIILDSVFGTDQFRNEIIWRRTASHNSAKRFGPIHDVLLFFSKSDNFYFKAVFRPYLRGHAESYFKKQDAKGHYWTNALTGAGLRGGASGQPWRRYNPSAVGRHWAIPGRILDELGIDTSLSSQEKLDALDAGGFVDHPAAGSNAMPTYRQYLEDSPGMRLQDIWAYQPYTQGLLVGTEEGIDEDVRWLSKQGDPERLGYPTQKPLGLLERIISSSCIPTGTVLDPFCGCGTTIAAAQKLGRRWVGIDITHLAIALQKYRLQEMFPGATFKVIGEPQSLGSARQLAQDDRFQFQWWALSLVKARPAGGQEGSKEGKKGADKGIDGIITFIDDATGKPKRIIVQVKSGKVGSRDIRDLAGTINRENAAIGVFITLEEPTTQMITEAAAAGFYTSPGWNQDYPRIQLLTVRQLLAGAAVQMPPTSMTFKQAQRVRGQQPGQMGLFDE